MEEMKIVVTEKDEFKNEGESVSTAHSGKLGLSGLWDKEQNV